MKSILIVIKPEQVVKILMGEKTAEILKTMPKCDLPIDVYIYCTKIGVSVEKDCGLGFPEPINGKVLAKFTLKRIDDISRKVMRLYAWNISDLQIFDKPKELSEFFHGFKLKNKGTILFDYDYEALRQRTLFGYEYSYPLKKAPRSWCYVEVRE